MINILMCTYNGERYIREQLDSIVAQKYQDWQLYIRDDGSADNTAVIIKEYLQKYPGKIFEMESPDHLGYPDCFWDMLMRCPEADYYAFCDQDDVWLDNKLESAVYNMNRLRNSKESSDCPVLYIHDYDNCDCVLDVISTHRLGTTDVFTDRNILFYTYASGFCMMINNAMRDRLNSMDLIGQAMYHDELCIWLGHFYGRIVYDNNILVKYRRHKGTVTEYGNRTGRLVSNWLRREIKGSEFSDKCERIRRFIGMTADFPDGVMSNEIKEEWLLLAGAKNRTGSYFSRLFYKKRLRPSLGGELALRLMFLLNKA